MSHLQKHAAYRFGLQAETIACFFLRFKGYRIIERRHRNHAGEVDIIAARSNTLIFTEVKARSNQAHITETLSAKQQQRITRAALLFLSHHPRFSCYNVRFDMILICPYRWPTHIPDAWRPL